MQRLPHSTCPDPFHDGTGSGLEVVHEAATWSAISYECRTCGFQTMRHVIETWLDQIKVVCPGCDAIRLDWDDAPTRCQDCRLRDVRMVTFFVHEPVPDFPLDEMALEALIEDWPSIFWPWSRVLEELDR